jgi:hypothetical protein
MKLLLGPPPNSLSDVQLTSGNWKRVAHIPMWALQVVAPIVGGGFAFALFAAWAILSPGFAISFAPSHQVIGATVAVILSGLVIQLGAHPSMGVSASSVVGFWPSRVTFYTAYTDVISRRRCLLQMASPFLVMSVVPLAAATSLGVTSGWLVFASCAAGFIFGVNVLVALWITFQVPAGSLMRGRGFQHYWSVSEPEA